MKEWLRRALRTFLQAALGYASANIVAFVSGVDFSDVSTISMAVTGLVAATVAAGFAAVMNLEKKTVLVKLDNNADTTNIKDQDLAEVKDEETTLEEEI